MFAWILILSLMLPGCSILWGNPGNYQNLTPDQIEAYKKNGQRVYSCTSIAGPPPAGRVIFITVPVEAPMPAIAFGADCQVR